VVITEVEEKRNAIQLNRDAHRDAVDP
jgi:hypothetical protein